MNKFLASVFVVFASLSLVASANAQAAGLSGGQKLQSDLPAGKAKGVNQLKVMQDVLGKLNLNDQQKTTIKSVFKDFAKDTAAIRKSVKAGTITKADAQPKHKVLREKLMASITGVLTTDQVKTFRTTLREEMKKLRQEKKAGTPPPTTTTPPPAG